ncbi:penicillin-binding protein 2 [Anaerolineales bacterium HSG24]|nr:penicillin-binding protein 2 [Anaerolineales bacterium HSG24]
MTPKIPRRTFLKMGSLAMLLSGCQSNLPLPLDPTEPFLDPTATIGPTPTAIPNADTVAQAYLSAWQRADYQAMYDLLTPDSRILLRTPEQLQQYYLAALNTATVNHIEPQLQSLLYEGYQALVGFQVTWQTNLFGSLNMENQMRLSYIAERWGVQWQPTLVMPQLGESMRLAFLSQQPTRGNIYDQQNHALATQGEIVIVGLIPQLMENEAIAIRHLAAITKADPEKIKADLANAQPDWFVPIAEIDFEASVQYDDLLNNIPGVERRVRQSRAYNDADIASHIIGYMGQIPADQRDNYLSQGYQGDELVGLIGIERWGEPYLAGQRGGRLVTLSSQSEVLSEIGTATAKAGSSLYLTIDTAFQAQVEQLLGPRLGAVVVINPYDGTIYALVSYPRFEPAVFTPGFEVDKWLERYSGEDRPLINRATHGLYPPASIFKIVTIAAALEEIGAMPDDSFFCTGQWAGLGAAFQKKCWLESGHGKISLFDGLTESCDVVFYETGLALHRQDPTLLPKWAKHFGLGVPTSMLELNESIGVVPDNAWKQATLNEAYFDGDAVNAAIGQGYTLSTPLQIARLMSVIANGGSLIRPRLVERIVEIDGLERLAEPTSPETVPISPENLALIQRSLSQVVSGVQGTARKAFAGFADTVAGKTGTAETSHEVPHAWFSGYTPVENPQVVITVLLEHAGEGSSEAAPLFRQVAEAFFDTIPS